LAQNGRSQSFSYSIANSFNPKQANRLQLFIQNTSETTNYILEHLRELYNNGKSLNVTLPMGRAFLQTNLNLTHVLIASGSGISKIKCITEEILKRGANANVHIYWSNREMDDFYLLETFQNWVHQNTKLSFTRILESANAGWPGRSGYIYKVINEDFTELDGTQVYLCGSPNMVYGTIDKLKSNGLKEENCYSDVFEYAPRDQKIAI